MKIAVLILSPILVFIAVACVAGAARAGEVRASILAGQWYPAGADELRAEIRGFLDAVPPLAAKGRLLALISPHAGYVYSGSFAAYGYSLLREDPGRTVVVVAPSHHMAFAGVAVYDQGGFRTPLGVAPLDRAFIAALMAANPMIRSLPEAHAQEHAVEIQLPFLQVTAPGFSLVPLIMGSQDPASCRALADAIVAAAAATGEEDLLLVASSDLSHFHTAARAGELDAVVRERVAGLDPEGLLQDLAQGRCEACGGGPMAAVMLAARAMGADSAEILAQGDSSAASGETSRVVGYLSAALWDTGGAEARTDDSAAGEGILRVAEGQGGATVGPVPLSNAEREELRRLARASVLADFAGDPPPEPELITPALQEVRGAFVTFTIDGDLRGCIGQIMGQYPLYETVTRMARAAAFEDPRFPPMSREEFAATDMEISALTPLARQEDPSRVEVGRDGLLVAQGGRRGVLLPQVPEEQGWNQEQFLDHTCMKAGLPAGCWREEGTELYVFQAEVF